jgi:hypothetical protein
MRLMFCMARIWVVDESCLDRRCSSWVSTRVYSDFYLFPGSAGISVGFYSFCQGKKVCKKVKDLVYVACKDGELSQGRWLRTCTQGHGFFDWRAMTRHVILRPDRLI